MKIAYNTLLDKNIADILVVTATGIETQMLHSMMKPICEDGILEISQGNHVYFAGIFGDYNIIHCQCENMGTQESGSSTLTTTSALSNWPSIKAVVMIGIAFGMYQDGDAGQHFSDVLIAKKLFPYENQRYNHDNSIEYRGKEHFAAQDFVDAFAVISHGWCRNNLNKEKTKIEICPLLSGEKLIDNLEKRDNLKVDFPEYRGGEMEGIGLAAACEANEKPWILLKAICDFADGNKGTDKRAKQEDAALAAVLACEAAFETSNVKSLIGRKTNYRYRSNNCDFSKIFFMHYDDECFPYYLIRSIDNQLIPFILTKNCWVYGKTGMGKSELLTRTLKVNSVEHIYIDLSLCSSHDVLDTFRTILDVISETLDISINNINNTFEDYVKSICKILDCNCRSKQMYLLIDEIPFDNNGSEFFEFVQKFCSMINYFSRNLKNRTIFFMLSSIISPKEALKDEALIDKFSQYIKFLEISNWTSEECVQLIDLLSNKVCLTWDEISSKDFASEFKYSPRLIKNALKEACSLGYRKIDKVVINRIKIG